MVHLGEQAREEEERRQLVPVWPPGEGRPPASPAHKKDQKVTVIQGCFIFINSMRFGQFHTLLASSTGLLLASSTGCWPVPQVVGQFHRMLTTSTGCWPVPQVDGQFHRLLAISAGC